MHRVSIPREVDEEAPCCGGSGRFGKEEQPAAAKAIRMTLACTISFTAAILPASTRRSEKSPACTDAAASRAGTAQAGPTAAGSFRQNPPSSPFQGSARASARPGRRVQTPAYPTTKRERERRY